MESWFDEFQDMIYDHFEQPVSQKQFEKYQEDFDEDLELSKVTTDLVDIGGNRETGEVYIIIEVRVEGKLK